MAPTNITLYVDIVSPFGYYAFHILRTSPTFKTTPLTLTPVLLGGIMSATSNQPPINIRNKAQYVGRQRVRWARRFNIPASEDFPEPFPQNTLTAQRALCAVQVLTEKTQAAGAGWGGDVGEGGVQGVLGRVVEGLFKAFWVDGKRIDDVETVKAALVGVLGEAKAGEVMGLIKSEEVKTRLKKNTEEALEEGCFGLPWMVCTNEKGKKEGFWGVDHLGLVCDFMGLDRSGLDGLKALL